MPYNDKTFGVLFHYLLFHDDELPKNLMKIYNATNKIYYI